MSIPTVICEGTYGCVHKPSLICKNQNIDYTNKVSKYMKNIKAKKEMAEYSNIQEIDKDTKYYLGNPISCNLDENEKTNIDAI
jgi:hypothetical protein